MALTIEMQYFLNELENDGFGSDIDSQDINETSELCLITQVPLQKDYVTLVCGHKFNYDAIFNDIYNHKKKSHDLETTRLKGNQIRCPYCRNIQQHVLPCPPGKKQVHGVNIDVIEQGNHCMLAMQTPSMYWYNYRHFAKGYCCYGVKNITEVSTTSVEVCCPNTMVMYNDVDERVYCKAHLKNVLTHTYNNNLKMAKKTEQSHKKMLADIARKEKELAKQKAALIEKQDINSKTVTEVQNWYSNKMFNLQNSSSEIYSHIPENVVVSNSDPTLSSTPIPPSDHKKPVNRCLAITVKNKTQCSLKAIIGSTYCAKHLKNI